ncbi:hypothetical protein ALMA_0062 [Alloscardovia macacae]|uniref:Uncharacterized protein n=1 Tax=Alloscardovia macacae TaxID=1160091 RepID=A0A261F6H0_9BIFI|nr:hypothetical protein ALMA_0062 [Alloscardovia macacae]
MVDNVWVTCVRRVDNGVNLLWYRVSSKVVEIDLIKGSRDGHGYIWER